MAEIYKSGKFITNGEEKTAEVLQQGLPDEWLIICNKLIIGSKGQSYEMDFIVVGRHAIYVTEEKGYTGKIDGTTDSWIFESGETVHSPFNQVDFNAKVLAGLLRKQYPKISELVGREHFVVGIVLISTQKNQYEVRAKDPRVNRRLFCLDNVCEALLELDRYDYANNSLSSIRIELCKFLKGIPSKPNVPKKINRYRIIEKLHSPTRFCQTYKAIHEDLPHQLFVLKVFPLEYMPNEGAKKRQQENIMRGFKALRHLSESEAVPLVDPPFDAEDGNIIVCTYRIPEGKSLRALIEKEKIFKPKKALTIVLSICNGLDKIHNEGILHRNISPLTVYLTDDDPPSVCFTDFELAKILQEETINSFYEGEEFDSVYMAPELKIGLGFAEKSSDLYPIGIMLFEMITGELPTYDEIGKDSLSEKLIDLSIEIIDKIQKIIVKLIDKDERNRPQSAIEVCEELKKLLNILPADNTDSVSKPQKPSHYPKSGDFMDNDRYEIKRLLGESATSLTYLANDATREELCVLKRLKKPFRVLPFTKMEFEALKGLNHHGIVKLIDVYPIENSFHFKYEYIEGPTLEERMCEAPLDQSELSDLGKDLLETLVYLEEQNVRHCDIAPKNIIFNRVRKHPRIVDFGLSQSKNKKVPGIVGTPLYMPPEVEKGEPHNETSDLYGMAVILYRLATGKVPFILNEEGYPNKAKITELNDKELSTPVWNVLRKALSPQIKERFQNAAQMLESWNAAFTKQPPISELIGERILNPWVTKLQQLYRNSRKGNQENRGLDSEFAREGYIPTALDMELVPRILDKQFCLVFLTGNPGDGKTALLESVETTLLNKGATQMRKDSNGWSYEIDGHTYIANYDASESHSGLSSDEILTELFKNFSGNLPPSKNINKTILLAVNDGRLRGYFLFNQAYDWLGKQIVYHLNGEEYKADQRVMVVDLKWRTLITKAFEEVDDNEDFFDKTLNSFLRADFWEPCNKCMIRNSCPIKFNVDTLSDTYSGAEVKQRLKALFRLVVLRGRHQLTIRDMRSLLSFIIVNIQDCESLHKNHEDQHSLQHLLNSLYFNAIFNVINEPDEFLEELSQYDPGTVYAPRLERKLHHNKNINRMHIIEECMLLFKRGYELLQQVSYQILSNEYYPQAKRRYFFESDEAYCVEQLFPWKQLLPYRHLLEFLMAIRGEIPNDIIREYLVEGITKSDGLAETSLTNGKLCIKTNENEKQELIVFRQYPSVDFECQIEMPPCFPWLEAAPRHLIFRHKQGKPALRVGLDLFEMLMRFREGYQPLSEELMTFLLDLGQFKAQLLRQEATELVLLEAGRRLHLVKQKNGKIIRTDGGL